ncbi:MAG: YbaN family protein [Betaproteobacteria bacterium]|nr:YbaN family protein [Betaproteobacteria bacterium]
MKNAVFVTAGTLFLILGIAGIFLPLLPATPFLLLASACYLRGSERLHRWLLSHGKLGAYIRAFEEGKGIPRRAKIVTLAMLWTSMSVSIWWVAHPWVQAALLAIALAVTVWIARMPTARRLR